MGDAGTDASSRSPLADDRSAAEDSAATVVSLLGSRTDHAGRRFDAEVDAALNDGRLDPETARALRWWQRASVRAVEDYAATVLPSALAARDAAEARAASDANEADASWRQAQALARTDATARTDGIRWNHPTRLVAVPHLADRADQQAAVRAAFRSPGVDPAEHDEHLNVAASASSERKDDRGHAHPATSA